MFFFQDDIGNLIQIASTPFLLLIRSAQAEHFVPFFKLFSFTQYKLFGLNFPLYAYTALIIHFFNCILLYHITIRVLKRKLFALFAVAIFSVNITYVEPFLWWSAQGELLSLLFLGSAFLLWLQFTDNGNKKKLFFSLLLLLMAGFSYGVAVGAGIIFAAITYIYKVTSRNNLTAIGTAFYIFAGVISYASGLIFTDHKPIPYVVDPLRYTVNYLAFVFAGVTRGVVGRVFFPGFDPRHFEIIPTIISFIPFLLVIIMFVTMFRNIRTKEKRIMLVLSVMIVYPYIWAGVLRVQFGLKQALAERYAYVSLFFFSILFSCLLSFLIREGFIRSKRILILLLATIMFLQSGVFFLKAKEFEVRPLLTKRYFEEISYVFTNSTVVINLPIPSYINQPYKIADLVPVLAPAKKFTFVEPEELVCDNTIRSLLNDKFLTQFYRTQSKDWVVQQEFTTYEFRKCTQVPFKSQ